ncbi:sodium:solute symporter [Colwellia sp. 75C3]|uniref:sodium:solute symporter family transporter n=1 Tax=Colwellia sp. 75C3 TaxID=888425 RepID=UPI000C3292A5|nr:sodium/solute symporter [Colwellia sp. 75C3]PKG83073.1 sodium:solute symporter [Colwellia sp. 75C3]
MFKYAVISFLMMPLFTNAQTIINWQEVSTSSVEQVDIGHGAFISKQNNNLIISSGVNIDKTTNKSPFIAEKLARNNQLNSMYIVSGESVFPTTLTTELGNRAYAASASFHDTTLVIGGIAKNEASALVNIVNWQASSKTLQSYALPNLPQAASSPSTVIIDNTLYVLTGSDANNQFYTLDLSTLVNNKGELSFNKSDISYFTAHSSWKKLPGLPLASRNKPYQNAIQLAVQNDGSGEKIFAMGGYQFSEGYLTNQGEVTPLISHWKYDPSSQSSDKNWQELGDIFIAKNSLKERINTLTTLGQSHILAFTNQGNTLSFNAITKSWTKYLAVNNIAESDKTQKNNPQNNTVNSARFISESVTSSNGEVFSLNRADDNQGSLHLWQVSLKQPEKNFGWVNMTVLMVYLLGVVLLGLFFMFKNKNTDDYFRGGQSIPWWAAACSIYATLLSSLTYVALPAMVYQTNWLVLIGIWMIVVAAPIAVYVAMPFFRQINATSAYEYLSKRFNMTVRLFASGLFTLFHISRMGIVMALTALALSAVTPLSASDSVLIMGVLCLIYCTMGGIEAVIWTDTLQTIVLLIGAVICFITIIMGLDGGLTDFIRIGLSDDKFTMVNADFSSSSIMTLSIWVIVLGGIGQNLASYTADQSIVQRYMVTKDSKAAAKSIWANVAMAVPGTLLFFCIGTGLYAFYQMHPEKLDPTIQIDQIFPMFIATELPIGLAGLIVAGIFAAAQSTVSTSMNSTATTLITDFIKPFNLIKTEKGYLNAARWLTFVMGALGTLAGLVFINPEIYSLMAAYFKVIGMFMGVLGGLFVLGALTKRANSTGAIIGIISSYITTIAAWQLGWANGYLYATIGIFSCLIFGYIGSLLTQTAKSTEKDLTGLTLYTMHPPVTK